MERDVKYIQLPPLPEDIDVQAIEAIWLLAKMSHEEREDALQQLRAMIGDEDLGKMDHESVKEIMEKYSSIEDEKIFSEFIEYIRKLIATLIVESADVAGFVYQKYCVENQSIEYIMSNTRLTENIIRIYTKYFDCVQKNK